MAIKRDFILSSGIGISANDLYIVGSTASTNSTSGALIVTGGVGIGQSVNIGGRVGIGTNLLTGQINIRTSSASTPGLVVQGSTSQTADYAQFYTSTGTTSLSITKDAEIKFPLAQDVKLYATAYGSVGAIKTTGNFFAYGGLIFAYGVSDELSGYLSATAVSVSGLNWSTYSSGADIRWATNNPVRIQPTGTTVVPLVINNQSASWTSGNAFEIANNGVLKYSIDYAGSTSIASTTGSGSTTTGALKVTGGVGIGGSIFGGSTISAADNIEIKSAKELRLNNSGNTFYTGIKAGANASNTTYTFPVAFPGTGTSILQSDTSGTLTWVAMTASGGGAGTVNNGSVNAIPYYPSAGTSITGSSSFTNVGTGISILYAAGTSSTSTGALVVTGGVGIGQSVSVGGRLQMFNGANYTAFVSSASGNTVYTLPATSPATGSSVLQSTSAGVMSWVPMTSGSSTPAGTSDGVVQFKSSSSLGGTLSLFFDPLLLGLRVSGFPGGETPTSTSAALKLESTVGSFNGSVNGTYYAANAPTGFAGDLMNLQINSVSKFRIDNTGAIIQNIGTNATSTTSGSVQVRGGLGITGALFTGESINSTATTNSTSTTSGSLIVSGGAGFAGTINVGGTAKIFSSTASTNTSTGALLVGGGVGISGQLTFTQASLGFTGVTINPSMSFIGATTSSPITLTVLTDNSLNWEGSQGSVFSIDSNLSTGEIFSVSDISGLPIISASAGQTVNINEFGGFTQIGNGSLNSSSSLTGSLVVSGGVGITGNANIGGTVRITNTTATTSSSSGAFTVSGGAGIAQSLFVGGSIVLSNNIYSGGNNFAKAGQAPGDIIFDNNSNDTAGLLYYYKNNTNFGLDVYAVGSGTTRFRIVKDLNESGGSELWSVDRNGVVLRTGWDVGEVIATRVYNNTDLNMQSTNTIGITSYVTIATITYTPKSSSSYLWIEFDAHYDFNGGTTVDDYFSRITVGGSTIMEKNQIFLNAPGGGTRSGVLFPISGRYTNTSTSGIAITVQARRGTADDDLRVFGSSTSGYMRIQEIGR